jgi:hypothetical protein
MKQFLCLKDLVMKTDGRIELTAGKLYRETKPIGDRDNAVINNSGKTHNNVQRWGVFVETFERDGVEWIRHDGGDCPVPGGWKVEFSHESGGHVFGRGGLLARLFCWGPIVEYRIISTGEPEQVVRGDVLHFTQQGFKRHQDHVLGGLEDMLQKEKDSRPLSPQETAYAAKMAEKDEDESGAGGGKTFPSSALRDMSDKTFANLLGMGQFIGGEE